MDGTKGATPSGFVHAGASGMESPRTCFKAQGVPALVGDVPPADLGCDSADLEPFSEGNEVKDDAAIPSRRRTSVRSCVTTNTESFDAKPRYGKRTNLRGTIRQSMQAHYAEEELEQFEYLQRMRRIFLENDLNHDGVITADDLRALADKVGGGSYEVQHIESVVEHLKIVAQRQKKDSRLEEEGIPFDIFAEILHSYKGGDGVDEGVLASVKALRAFFRDCSHARVLAEAADVNAWEINAAVHEKTLGARILKKLDPIMGFIIFSNAVVIGLSLDYSTWNGWEILEYFFVISYVLEVSFKVWYFGASEFFLGVDWNWNVFDTCLAGLGIVDVVLSFLATEVNLGPLMYIRLLRVTRLVRLVRLMRAFKDLSIMVTGFLHGFKIMMWVMVLLAMCVYSVAIVLTSTVGRDEQADFAYREELFSTVKQSMFTVFTCLTDGCSNFDGTPISHHLFRVYGMKFFFAYTLVIVFVTFGLFNLIMAIFVENTMQAAKSNDQLIAAARHKENLRVARKLRMVIQQFTMAANAKEECREQMLHQVKNQMKAEGGLRRHISWILGQGDKDPVSVLGLELGGEDLNLSRQMFESILETEAVQQLMDELEIDETNRNGLFEMLDSDGNDSLSIEELVEGLMAVRGQPKKSDTIATMLAVKSMQKSFRSTSALLLQNQHLMETRLGKLERSQSRTHKSLDARLEKLEEALGEIRALLHAQPVSTL